MTGTLQDMQPAEVRANEFAAIFDIRPHATSTPTLGGAVAVRADELTSDPSRFIPTTDAQVLIICDIGIRSAVVTAQLRSAGFTRAVSLEGGIEAWVSAQYPTVSPLGLTPGEFARYDRQLKLPGFGVTAQQALHDAGVAIVGVGGLGVPVLSYLAGAGVGHITVIDSDTVEISNLHRQPIYSVHDEGRPKAEVASEYARGLNPGINVSVSTAHLDDSNARAMLDGHDVVVTCTDRFETTHAINRAAVELAIPMVFGSVYRTEGQFGVFDVNEGPCYACVFPASGTAAALDCSIVGVLGPVTGVIGSIQATETIKLITGTGESATGTLKLYDATSETVDTLIVRKATDCNTCAK